MRDAAYAFIPTEQYNYVVQQLEELFQNAIIDSAYFILNQYPIFNQVIALCEERPVVSYLISCALAHPLSRKALYLAVPSLSVVQELKDVEIFNHYCVLPNSFFQEGRLKDLDAFLLPEALGDCAYSEAKADYALYENPYLSRIAQAAVEEGVKVVIRMATPAYRVFEMSNVNGLAELRLRLYLSKATVQSGKDRYAR